MPVDTGNRVRRLPFYVCPPMGLRPAELDENLTGAVSQKNVPDTLSP